MIPQSRPHLCAEGFAYVEEILRSRYVARGPLTDALERELAQAAGVCHVTAVSHGTAALHLALLALGVGPGDEIVLPSYTGVALLHAINYCGATPVLVDINAEAFNPTADLFRPLLTVRTKAIILTHTFGFSADLAPILDLGVPVIEDCSLALGARNHGRPVGSWGVISTFSFYATKMICAGEGGAVATNDRKLAERVRDLTTPDQRPTYRVRYNYKLSDLAAGLALSQLRKLDSFVARRHAIARRYEAALAGCPVRLQQLVPDSEPSYYRFVARAAQAGAVIRQARVADIACDRPVYRPQHRYLDYSRGAFRQTDAVWRSGVSIPLYPDLSELEIAQVETTIPALIASLGARSAARHPTNADRAAAR